MGVYNMEYEMLGIAGVWRCRTVDDDPMWTDWDKHNTSNKWRKNVAKPNESKKDKKKRRKKGRRKS